MFSQNSSSLPQLVPDVPQKLCFFNLIFFFYTPYTELDEKIKYNVEVSVHKRKKITPIPRQICI